MNLIPPPCLCSRRFPPWKPSGIILAMVLLLGGCGRTTEEAETGGELRIVSLSPAFTRNLVDLGLGDMIVGRTPYCHAVPADTPVIGDLQRIDFETLVRVRPTHLFVQPARGGVDRELTRLAEERGWTLYQRTIDDLADIVGMVGDVPGVIGGGEAVKSRAETLARQLNDLILPQEVGWAGRVLLITTDDPHYAYGKATYLSDMLEALGSVNVVEAEGWVRLTLEDIVRLNPEGVLVVRAVRANSGAVAEPGEVLSGLDIQANQTGRVGVLAHPEVVLPSSSLIEVHFELRGVLGSWGRDEP